MTIAARTGPALDEHFMDQALALAKSGIGTTAPNPSVGALVVQFDASGPIIVGSGVTAPGGRPHAERLALQQAGAAARGATLYVTLEPCGHRSVANDGPSCSDAILAAGISRIVIATEDPSPFASGEGVRRLADAGLVICTGVCHEAARKVNLGHILRMRENRPFVTLKLAQTADGFAGTSDGKPIAITGDVSFGHTHTARAEADAIMVGVGTVLGDDPKLNVRLPGLEHRAPIRVILDGQLRTPATAFMVRDSGQIPTWIFASHGADEAKAAALRAGGADITRVATTPAGRLDLREILGALSARGITRLMVEGGPTLSEALADADFIDEFTLMTGPDNAGRGLVAVGPALRRWMADTARVTRIETAQWGADRAEIFERSR